jgi:hypothetical protein
MDFIYTNPNSLSKEICEDIIELYERDKKYVHRGVTGIGEDLKIKDMMLLNKSAIIIYNKSSLNDLHKEFMSTMGKVCKLTKVRKTTIIKMQYTKQKINEKT